MKTVHNGREITWRRFFPCGLTYGVSEGEKNTKSEYFAADRRDVNCVITPITKNEFFATIPGKTTVATVPSNTTASKPVKNNTLTSFKNKIVAKIKTVSKVAPPEPFSCSQA